MRDSTDHLPISEFEDLDPEPAPRQGQARWREFVVGVLLLLGVLGFAGWQWWQGESNKANYEAGQQAVDRHDWDSAQRYFQAAHDYKDAPVLAQNAATNVVQRDKHYSAALKYAADEQWVQALNEISAIREIQPHYSHLDEIGAEVESHVYEEAMPDGVVRWPSANPSGLYYRAKSGWAWLQGSDTDSRILSVRSDSVLFDVPLQGGAPRRDVPMPPPGLHVPTERGLAMTQLDPEVTTGTLKSATLPVTFPDGDMVAWGKRGVWVTGNTFYGSGGYSSAVRQAMTPRAPLTYVTPDLSASATISLSDPLTNTALLTMDSSDEDLLLMADWTIDADKTTSVTVYLADAFGKVRRPLYTIIGGGIVKANFSLDGKHILLVTYTTKHEYEPYDLALVLLDPHALQPPVTLLRQLNVPALDEQSYNGTLHCAYLVDGPFAGKVLVAEWTDHANRVSLLDPASPGTTVSSMVLPIARPLYWAGPVANKDTLFLLGYLYFQAGGTQTDDASQFLVTMKAGEGLRARYIKAPVQPFSLSVSREDLLLVGPSVSPDDAGKGYSISSMPLSSLNQDVLQAQLVYSHVKSRGEPDFYGYLTASGSGALAYIDGHDLHVRSYDGLTDLKLTGGISMIQWTQQDYEHDWLR
jgi:hypothetical protein